MSLRHAGQADQGLEIVLKCAEAEPENAELLHICGGLLLESHQYQRAIDFITRAIAIQENNLVYYKTLGDAHTANKDLDAAQAVFTKAIEIDPSFGPAYQGLASIQLWLQDYSAAEQTYRAALASHTGAAPDPIVICGLAKVLLVSGRPTAAVGMLTEGQRAIPGNLDIRLSLCTALNYADPTDPVRIIREHLDLARLTEAALQSKKLELDINSDPDRSLRIGYLSADFREHSCAFFVESLLDHHDRQNFHTTCYATFLGSNKPDHITDKLKEKADQWRHITQVSDAALANQIADDKIDILFDLMGYTSGGRLQTILLKPAPIIINYLGYPNITGLSTVDARFVDQTTDPKDRPNLGGERLIRLPSPFLCYTPKPAAPDINPLPSERTGEITFGSFNIAMKISPTTVDLWAKILLGIPGSRLILKSRGFKNTDTTERFRTRFAEQGLGEDRVDLLQFTPTLNDHLELYNKLDLALDTWPYNGTTTTCESLWMGVPVVTIKGSTHASRVSASILNAIGAPELVATTPDEFVNLAIELACDENRLINYRKNLRTMMQSSPLCDGATHTLNVEKACRRLWRSWCRQS